MTNYIAKYQIEIYVSADDEETATDIAEDIISKIDTENITIDLLECTEDDY